MNSIKIFLGNVYLTIPAVFKETGVIGGMILYITVAILNTYTMSLILHLAQKVSRTRNSGGEISTVKSYSDLGKRLQGPKGKVLVDIALFIA